MYRMKINFGMNFPYPRENFMNGMINPPISIIHPSLRD